MIDFRNKTVFKLKQNDEFAAIAQDLLIEGESVVGAYKAMRDGVIFTDRRVIAVNVQGLTGSKKDFTSLPYRSVTAYSIETAGTLDLDAELELVISTLGSVKFEFSGKTNLTQLSALIAGAIL